MRIVVADDEPDMRDYFEKILPLLGHEVLAAAEDGDALVAACENDQPDLVITDIKMPGLDGLEAIRRIRAFGPVRVVVITGHGETTHLRRAAESGVNAFLVKPIKRADLEAAIERATAE
jgi:CheY-like chemotaxis protein